MQRHTALVLSLACVLSSNIPLRAAEPAAAAAPAAAKEPSIWTTDFAAAQAAAALAGKDILLDFTGSDWCGWCIKLKQEVFSTPAFLAAAPEKFVLVEVDFPRDSSKLTSAVRQQNERLQEKFQVSGYPTILLLDAQGRPYATTGYHPGGVSNYLANLAELRKIRDRRDAAWKKAESATGVQKARLLAEGLSALDDDLVAAHYASVLASIKTLDPQDSTGLMHKMDYQAKLDALQQAVSADESTPESIRKLVEAFVATNKPAGEDLQKALLLKLGAYPPRTLDNINQALKLLDDVQTLAPTSTTAQVVGRIQAGDPVQGPSRGKRRKAGQAVTNAGVSFPRPGDRRLARPACCAAGPGRCRPARSRRCGACRAGSRSARSTSETPGLPSPDRGAGPPFSCRN